MCFLLGDGLRLRLRMLLVRGRIGLVEESRIDRTKGGKMITMLQYLNYRIHGRHALLPRVVRDDHRVTHSSDGLIRGIGHGISHSLFLVCVSMDHRPHGSNTAACRRELLKTAEGYQGMREYKRKYTPFSGRPYIVAFGRYRTTPIVRSNHGIIEEGKP